MPAANYNATVLANGAAGENVMLLTARWDETTPAPACGQFYMLRAWKAEEAPLLSRPISVHRFDREKKEISFLYEVRGTGTQKLAALRPGDTVALTGPSGRGFPVDGTLGGSVALVGGGIGVPPMLGCVREAVKQGAKPAAILGFRNKGAVILEGDFRDECETFVTTDDGSYARHGFVTDVLKEQIASASGVAACGPKPMLKAIAAIAKQAGVPCQVSMEERMGCGIGACLVCACALKAKDGETRYGHVCKDGPVFNAEEVEW